MDFTYSASFRLKTRPQIQHVLKNARKLSVGPMAAFITTNDAQHPRLAIIIAKRYIKHAVRRNKIKRIIKESFRHNKQQLPSIDIVIRVYKDIDSLERPDIRKCIDNLFNKLAV